MSTARLMDRPEDLERLGLEASVVRTWEDGRRDTDEPMHNEVWYFDATADDGTKIVVGFRPKLPGDMGREVSSPNLNINVIAPDGQEFVDFIEVDPADAEMADDRCHVRYGQHCVTGNLREYHVVVAPVNGVGVDLRYEALVEPFRPGGTAHVALGADDEYYYTDFSIPRNRVTGTVIAGGRTWEITGSGYHDHQWMNIPPSWPGTIGCGGGSTVSVSPPSSTTSPHPSGSASPTSRSSVSWTPRGSSSSTTASRWNAPSRPTTTRGPARTTRNGVTTSSATGT